jgi:hypothetical protein
MPFTATNRTPSHPPIHNPKNLSHKRNNYEKGFHKLASTGKPYELHNR